MLGVYIFAMVLGGGLLLLSQLAGDQDHGGAGDHGGGGGGDHGHDVGVHGPGELLLGFFRPRNLIFFLAAFGLTGTLLPGPPAPSSPHHHHRLGRARYFWYSSRWRLSRLTSLPLMITCV